MKRSGPSQQKIESMLVSMVSHAFARSSIAPPPMIEVQYALLDGVFRWQLQGQVNADRRSAAVLEQVL
jgi:hypothetical protein